MMGYYGGMAGPWMLLPVLFFWLLILAGIGFVVYALVRRQPVGADASQDPLRALGVRYARGEIDREQYLRIREDLRSLGRQP